MAAVFDRAIVINAGQQPSSSRAVIAKVVVVLGVSPVDAPTLASFVVLLLVVGGAAAFLPSLRTSRTDPMDVLRAG